MKFEEEIKVLRATRENTIEVIKELSLEQLNLVPDGFTGNIAWHLGHMVQTHRGLIYQLNAQKSGLEKDFIMKYRKGSKPEGSIDQAEFEFITEQLLNQVDELEEDLQKEDFFGENHPYSTSYNYDLNSLEDCVKFSNVHQGLHLGYIMALKRIVK